MTGPPAPAANRLQAEKFAYLFTARPRIALGDGSVYRVTSYRDLAPLLSPDGLSEPYVNRLVNGVRPLRPEHIRRICQLWQISEEHWAASSLDEFRRRFSPLNGLGAQTAWNTMLVGVSRAGPPGEIELLPPAMRLPRPPGAPPPPPLAPHVFAPGAPFHVMLVASETRLAGWPLFLFHYEHDRACDCLIPTLYEEGSAYYATDRFPKAPSRIALTREPLVADEAPGLFGVLLAVVSPALTVPDVFGDLFTPHRYRAASHDPRLQRLADWALEQHGLGAVALLGVSYEVRAPMAGEAPAPGAASASR